MNTIPFLSNSKYILTILFTVLLVIACKEKTTGNTEVEVVNTETLEKTVSAGSIAFTNEETTKLFNGYLALKQTLVASNPEAAALAANELLNLPGVAGSDLESVLKEISIPDLAAQRKHFSVLGMALEPRIKSSISTGAIFKQYCPMAFQNTGGYWLSDSETIRNPYFGDAMLTCGTVSATWKSL